VLTSGRTAGMENMAWISSSVRAAACIWIGDWDKPDQVPSFGFTIRWKDSHPCFHLLEEGFPNPYRSPTVHTRPLVIS
jgi:hypothetical protein